MTAIAWTDGLGLEQGREERRPFAAGDAVLSDPCRAQVRKGLGQRLAGFAGP